LATSPTYSAPPASGKGDGQIYRYTDIQTYRYTDIQIYRYTDIQIDRYTDIQTKDILTDP